MKYKNGLKKVCTLLVVASAISLTSGKTAHAASWNLSGDLGGHDPSIVRENNTWWCFTTGDDGIGVKYSSDGKKWTQGTSIFSKPLSWWKKYSPKMSYNNVWAPDVRYYNGRYWIYYSVSEFGTRNSAIGLTSCSSIQKGDWRDDGVVISSSSSTGYNAIDGNLVIDKNGEPYLAFGSWSDGLKVTKLNPKTMKPTGKIYSIAKRENGIEGPSIVYKNGYYYLFASIDKCCSGVKSDYKTVVGRSTSITGPYKDQNGLDMLKGGGTVIQAGTSRYKGTGGQTVYDNIIISHGYDTKDNGAPKILIDDLKYDSNKWPYIKKSNIKNGFYRLKNKNSGKYLEVGNANKAENANVNQWGNTNNACQEWMIYDEGNGTYRLQNRNSHKYLEVQNADKNNGANVIQHSNTASSCQEWKFVKVGDYYKIVNSNSNRALDVLKFSKDNGANIIQYSASGTDNQLWKLEWVKY